MSILKGAALVAMFVLMQALAIAVLVAFFSLVGLLVGLQ